MVIDLDASRPVAEPRRRSPAVLLALVLVALLGLGGSDGPRPELRLVLMTESASGVFAVTGTALFTADPELDSPGATVRRHPLGGDPASWTVALPHRVDFLGRSPSGELLIASAGNHTGLSVLDSRTGAVRWTDTGDLVYFGLIGDTFLVRTGEDVIRRIRLTDGRPLWSLPHGAQTYFEAGDPIVSVAEGGLIRVNRLADGAELARLDLGTDVLSVTRVDTRLFVARTDSLTAYELPGLRELWRSTAVPDSLPSGCGRHLCVGGSDWLTVLDPADGRTIWSAAGWTEGYPSREAGIPGSDRLVMSDRSDPPQRAFADPDTGRILRALGPSTLLGEVVLRPDAVRVGRTWVQRAGVDDRIRTAGHLDTVTPSRCDYASGHLVCPTTTGSTAVWRVP